MDGYIQIKEAAKNGKLVNVELMNFALMAGLGVRSNLEIHGLFQQTAKNLQMQE